MSLIAAATLFLSTSVAHAQEAYDQRDAGHCHRAIAETLAEGTHGPEDVAALWLLRGRCWMLVKDRQRAERAYRVGLRMHAARGRNVAEPDRADDVVMKDVRAEVAAMATNGKAPALVSRAVNGVIEVRVVDDLGAATAAVVINAAGQRVAGATIDPGAEQAILGGVVLAHTFAGVELEQGLQAALIDKHGNRLLVLPIDVPAAAAATIAEPKVVAEPSSATTVTTTTTPSTAIAEGTSSNNTETTLDEEEAAINAEIDRALAPPGAAGWLGIVGGGLAAAGLGTGVVTGALAALALENNQPATGYLVGVGVGAAVFVAGGACMVVDALMTDDALRDLPPTSTSSGPTITLTPAQPNLAETDSGE
jgi:hypothetical protein